MIDVALNLFPHVTQDNWTFNTLVLWIPLTSSMILLYYHYYGGPTVRDSEGNIYLAITNSQREKIKNEEILEMVQKIDAERAAELQKLKTRKSPLEAFQTLVSDTSAGGSTQEMCYPTISPDQVDSQYLAVGVLLFVLIYLVIILKIRLFGKTSESSQVYFSLSSFFVGQLGFTMRRFFISFIVVLVFVGGFNVLGLIPYNASFTAQIVSNFVITFGLIAGIMLAGISGEGIYYFLRFSPSNVPVAMVPFLFVIEVLSFVMRMFSMSIRLFSNMVAGHSLLHLLGDFSIFLFSLSKGKTLFLACSLISVVVLYFWLFFELFVAFLQAYVFVLLYLLYIQDIEKDKH